ncbi:MAG: YdeI/OmpD-associated family protein [Patescibacteria group bacterium]
MIKKVISHGITHKTPADLQKALISAPRALAIWENITPLARNEWICWVISGKKIETRVIRIKKGISKLSGGMRRPCCWAGCIHR